MCMPAAVAVFALPKQIDTTKTEPICVTVTKVAQAASHCCCYGESLPQNVAAWWQILPV